MIHINDSYFPNDIGKPFEVIEEDGKLDILVSNAAVNPTFGPMLGELDSGSMMTFRFY